MSDAEAISTPCEPGGFVGDIYFGHPLKSTMGTHRWSGSEWVALPSVVEALAALLAAAKAERDEALWQAECAKDTLSAWFDRRELGHEAVDQAVVDAASGYLRTSRVGGMPRKQSDLIIGAIQDMARLGLFADLFARAALKGESHE